MRFVTSTCLHLLACLIVRQAFANADSKRKRERSLLEDDGLRGSGAFWKTTGSGVWLKATRLVGMRGVENDKDKLSKTCVSIYIYKLGKNYNDDWII